MKSNRILSLISVLVGLAMIIVGIVFLASNESAYTTSTDYASFGGDFYTYSYKGIRAAASNAAVTANQVASLNNTVSNIAGFAFIFAGLLIILSNIKQMISSGDLKQILDMMKNAVPAKPESAATEQPVSDAQSNVPESVAVEVSTEENTVATEETATAEEEKADQDADSQA